MNEQQYPQITPAARDGMPREVATEFLADLRVKLTNRFRKVCQDARETIYPSLRPIRLALDIAEGTPGHVLWKRHGVIFNGDLTNVISPCVVRRQCHRVFDTVCMPKTDEERFSGKLRTLSFGKLGQIRTRCDRRSDKMFKRYQKVLVAVALLGAAKIKLLAHLDAQQQKFDFLHGLTTAEIQRRNTSTTQNQ